VEKVLLVGYVAGDTPATDPSDVVALNHRLLRDLDGATYPGLALQVEDRETTTRWQRGRVPARRVAASLAVWTEDGDVVDEITAIVADVWTDFAVCAVTETVPRWRTDRATSATDPQPGVIVTSLLYRKPSMTSHEFYVHWRDVHQPMSLRIHPQHTYVRNLVTRTATPAGPPFDAVCEEGFASVDDVLEPSRFYGADLTDAMRDEGWPSNAKTIGGDVVLFLDTDHTVATIMREYRLRDFR
jgi:hypothetical protein